MDRGGICINTVLLPKSALRTKAVDCIEKYTSLSDGQAISIGLYIEGKKYIVDLNENEDSLFYDIGSISKTLIAHLILKIFDEEKLDIHKPVSEYLSLRAGRYPTVYELLTHTAGYHHLTPVEITLPRLLRHRYSHCNPYENITKKAVIKALERRHNANGGHVYGYSDFAYAVLALVAEAIKQKDFHVLLEEFLKKDLMLTDTSIARHNELPKSIHRGKAIPYWKWKKECPYIASGGLVSNVVDMLEYIRIEIENEDRYITQAHNICFSSFKKGENTGTCVGWHTYKNSKRLWHVGGVGTFRSSIMFTRKNKFGVVVLGNAKGVKSANVHFIAKMLYSEIKGHKIKIPI